MECRSDVSVRLDHLVERAAEHVVGADDSWLVIVGAPRDTSPLEPHLELTDFRSWVSEVWESASSQVLTTYPASMVLASPYCRLGRWGTGFSESPQGSDRPFFLERSRDRSVVVAARGRAWRDRGSSEAVEQHFDADDLALLSALVDALGESLGGNYRFRATVLRSDERTNTIHFRSRPADTPAPLFRKDLERFEFDSVDLRARDLTGDLLGHWGMPADLADSLFKQSA